MKNDKQNKQVDGESPMGNSAVLPDWMTSSHKRGARVPRGFRVSNLEFGSTDAFGGASSLQRIGLRELINADTYEQVDLKANHFEPGVLTGSLSDAMAEIETKFHSGVYDAAAMPLVEEYLAELRNMAEIQSRRSALIARRVSDVKEAKKKAREAVYDARKTREAEIYANYFKVQLAKAKKEDDREARKQRKLEQKQAKKQAHDDVVAFRRAQSVQKKVAKADRETAEYVGKSKKLIAEIEKSQEDILRKMAEEREIAAINSSLRIHQAADVVAAAEREAVDKALEAERLRLEKEIALQKRKADAIDAAAEAEERARKEYERLASIRSELEEGVDVVMERIASLSQEYESLMETMNERDLKADSGEQAKVDEVEAEENAYVNDPSDDNSE